VAAIRMIDPIWELDIAIVYVGWRL
jgi:hypothetical protein